MAGKYDRLASGMLMSRCDVACIPSLLQKLFHHPGRDTELNRDLVPSALPGIIRIHDALPQIPGKGVHGRRRGVYRKAAKVAKGRRVEALNLKFEIRKEEVEPRMDAKEREWGRERLGIRG